MTRRQECRSHLSSAPLTAELDGKTCFEAAWFNAYATTSPYTAARHPLTLPDDRQGD